MTVEGIDVSVYQQPTDYSLTGLSFGIAKVSEGTLVDPRYIDHMAKFASGGLVRMGYMFARDDVSIPLQAAFFVQHATDAEALFVDNEGAHVLTRAQLASLIAAVKAADPHNRKVGEYMSASVYMNGVGEDIDWIADYRAGATSPPKTFHQYTSAGNLDRDHFYGTLADLYTLVGRDVTPALVTNEDPMDIVRSPTWYELDGVTQAPGSPHSVGSSYSAYGVGNKRAFLAGGKYYLCIPQGTPVPHGGDVKHAVVVTVDGIPKATVTV